MEEELGDILFTIICMANSHQENGERVSLVKAYNRAIAKYNIRDKDRFK